MKNKEFREIQVSSSLLVFIFLAILVLGVFIFLLGVSVGKKQVQMAGPTTLLARPATETVSGEARPSSRNDVRRRCRRRPSSSRTRRVPVAGRRGRGPAGPQKPAPRTTAPEPVATKPAETKTTPAGDVGDLYYIQVGAFTDKTQADSLRRQIQETGLRDGRPERPADGQEDLATASGSAATRPRDKAVDLLAKLNARGGKRTGIHPEELGQIVHDS